MVDIPECFLLRQVQAETPPQCIVARFPDPKDNMRAHPMSEEMISTNSARIRRVKLHHAIWPWKYTVSATKGFLYQVEKLREKKKKNKLLCLVY
jgi:hypothetical protein